MEVAGGDFFPQDAKNVGTVGGGRGVKKTKLQTAMLSDNWNVALTFGHNCTSVQRDAPFSSTIRTLLQILEQLIGSNVSGILFLCYQGEYVCFVFFKYCGSCALIPNQLQLSPK